MNQINFSFTNYTQQKIPSRYFLLILKSFIKKLKIKNNIEINLVLVSKKRIKNLNYIYRKENKATDVLSFPIDITEPKKIPKSGTIVLGDIYICPTMVEKGELQNTFLHGLMHLIGYDHERNQKEWDRIEKIFLF